MAPTLRQAKFFYFLLIIYLQVSCASISSDNWFKIHSELKVKKRDSDFSLVKKIAGINLPKESILRTSYAKLHQQQTPLYISQELTRIGVGQIEALDSGLYGKLGSTSLFVADRASIATYDRLYWTMVRILSEKYACFIKGKVDRGQLVSFKCRDQRTVTMARKISKNFSIIQTRQYGPDGREIIRQRAAKNHPSVARVFSKRLERD